MKELASVFLKEKMKLKVDHDDILNDAFAYFKHIDFNPKHQLQIRMKGQPAVDTGGVARQVFYFIVRNYH